MPIPAMIHFESVFPEIAARETRSLYLPEGHKRLPSAQYAYLELYCDDPGCDCRRVLFQVCREDDPDKVLATITYGWESESFYARLLGGDRKTAREMTGASLDSCNTQSKYSEDLLELFREVLLFDKDYLERLRRHYRMFKKARRKQANNKLSPPEPETRPQPTIAMSIPAMTAFHLLCPEVASTETRAVFLPDGHRSLPSARYVFFELYCDSPSCDCQRVSLQVCREENPKKILATITYGWESESFYARLLGGDRKLAREMTGASLDTFNAQSKHSKDLLEVFCSALASDVDYVKRLQRHYRLFKKAVRKQAQIKRSSPEA